MDEPTGQLPPPLPGASEPQRLPPAVASTSPESRAVAAAPQPPPLPAAPAGVVPPVPSGVSAVLPATPPRPRKAAGRVLRGTLLAAAVAAVVALDTGVVPLPLSTPSASAPGVGAGARAGTGATSPGTPTTDTAAALESARDTAIDGALADMTAAYARNDEAGFLAHAYSGKPDVVAAMRTRFRNLRAIGYDTVTFAWERGTEHQWPADVTLASSEQGPDLAPAVTVGVVVTTQLAGFDSRPSVTVVPMTFGHQQGQWLVTSLVDYADSIGSYESSEPWLLGPVYVVRKPHAVVVGEAKRKKDVDKLALQVESAVGDVRAVWKQKSWNGKVVVYATTDQAFVDTMFGGREAKNAKATKEAVFDAKVEMTYTNALFGLADEPQKGAPRMVVTPFLLGRHDAQATAVLRHELTHVAFAYEGSDNTPTWLVEGIAEYTGFRTGGASVDGVGALARRGLPTWTWTELKRGTWKPTLVADPGEFYNGTSRHVADTYTTGWLTCLYIADTYGEQTLAKLYAASASLGPDADPDTAESAILGKVLKVKRAALTKGTASYSRRIRSRFL